MQIHNICTLSPRKERKWGKRLGRECHTPGSVRLLWYAATALSASSRDGQIRKQQPGSITKQNRYPEKTSNYIEKNAKSEASNISNSPGSESEEWGEKEKKGDLRAGKHLGMPWWPCPWWCWPRRRAPPPWTRPAAPPPPSAWVPAPRTASRSLLLSLPLPSSLLPPFPRPKISLFLWSPGLQDSSTPFLSLPYSSFVLSSLSWWWPFNDGNYYFIKGCDNTNKTTLLLLFLVL